MTSAAPFVASPRVATAPAVVEASSSVIVIAAPAPHSPTPTRTLTWSQMLAEGQRLLEAGSREVVTQIDRANARATALDGRVA